MNAQVQLTTAQSTRLQALFGYNSALAEFDRVTGTQSSYNERFDGIAPHATRGKTYYTGSDVDARGRSKRKSTLEIGNPTQKITYTNVGATLAVDTGEPAYPAYTMMPNNAIPIAPQRTSTSGATRASLRSGGCCSFGFGHKEPSATNESTSTIAAAQPNSQDGIGKSARPTNPCAAAGGGSVGTP